VLLSRLKHVLNDSSRALSFGKRSALAKELCPGDWTLLSCDHFS